MENSPILSVALLLGMIGFLFITLTFLIGMRIIKTPPKYRLHRLFGIIAFSASLVHAMIMMFFHP